MSLRINQNIGALIANRNLRVTDSARSKSLERLSSGLRINRASDDAAGLGISEKLRAQIRGLTQAQRNAQDGISLIQTAEGALQEVSSLLIRMRELAVQAANGSITDSDRTNIANETSQLLVEIDRIAETTEFNTSSLLSGVDVDAAISIASGSPEAVTATIDDVDSMVNATYEVVLSSMTTGSFDWEITDGTTVLASGTDADTDVVATVNGVVFNITAASVSTTEDTTATVISTAAHIDEQEFTFHIGANANQTTSISIGAMDTVTLGIDSIDISTVDGANTAIGLIDNAINVVSGQRSSLGAVQNRLEHTINNLEVAAENLAASESRIRDVDMAKEMTDYTRNQIMLQAGVAMLAQANMSPQMVLRLLG